MDLRYAFRVSRRSPGFTAVAVLSLALGIGANTAIFSLIHTLMRRTLPVREPGQLVELMRRYPGEPALNAFSWETYEYFRDNNHVFSQLMPIGIEVLPVRNAGSDPEQMNITYVAGEFFETLGMKPALGRLIGSQDSQAGTAVVSWSHWKRRFGLDPGILGKQVVVGQEPVTIVGVTSREFVGLQVGFRQDIWLPMGSRRDSVSLMGRLKPGTSITQARAEMVVLHQRSVDSPISNSPFVRATRMEVESASAGFSQLRQKFARPLLLIMAVVALLLLIACTNVASMLLARGTARHREMALRVSLGAGRSRLARQVLTESMVLSGAGSLLGILLAFFGTRVLVRIMTSGRRPFELDASLDGSVLLFTAAAALLTGLLFGLAPALQAWGSAPAASLRDGGRAGETRFRRLLGKSFVVAQITLSLVLLSSANLFLRHLSNGYADLGFQRDRVLLVTLNPSGSGYDRQQLLRHFQELLERMAAIPGVRSATLSGMTPVSGAGANRAATVEGYQAKPGELRHIMENWVAPQYFETFGTPLLAGRDFSLQDVGRPRVAIVNRTMARYYFGDASPIGKHVLFDGDNSPYEIVGMVADAKYTEMRETVPRTIYFNAFQEGRVFSHVALRTETSPAAMIPEVRRLVRDLLKTVPVARVTTLAEQVDASIVPERLIVTLSGLFGTLGPVLAAIGVYGLLAYRWRRRINEIGIRMALGATQHQVTRMVLRDALEMVGAGLLIGVPAALWGRKFAASLIPGLPENIVVPMALAAAMMMGIALIAAYVPARRAARVDPMEALRYE